MNPPDTTFIFVDFDGVIKVPPQFGDGGYGPHGEFCAERIKRLRDLCIDTGAKIVVTSDLRENGRSWVMKNLGPWITDDLMANQWCTPKIAGQVDRHAEVWEWMVQHHVGYENLRFAILEDTRKHFAEAPQFMADRVVWCNNRHGFVPSLYSVAISVLTHPVGTTY